MWAAFGGHVKTVTALLAKGADVEVCDEVVTLAENHVCPAVSEYTGSPLCSRVCGRKAILNALGDLVCQFVSA